MMRERTVMQEVPLAHSSGAAVRVQPARKIPRSIHEGAREMARDLSLTDAHATSQRERKKIENAARGSSVISANGGGCGAPSTKAARDRSIAHASFGLTSIAPV